MPSLKKNDNVQPITTEEVKKALAKLKNRKTAGFVGIPIDLVKYGRY